MDLLIQILVLSRESPRNGEPGKIYEKKANFTHHLPALRVCLESVLGYTVRERLNTSF